MKKIPTLFIRDEKNRSLVTREVVPELAHVLEGECVATVKRDGSCCRIDGHGRLWKRREVKAGKAAPDGFVDAGTSNGKRQGWAPVGDGPEDKWFREAFRTSTLRYGMQREGTYEAIGPHFQGGAERTAGGLDEIVPHGGEAFDEQYGLASYDEIKTALVDYCGVEGIVWWRDNEPVAKIKRKDFGLEWPIKQE